MYFFDEFTSAALFGAALAEFLSHPDDIVGVRRDPKNCPLAVVARAITGDNDWRIHPATMGYAGSHPSPLWVKRFAQSIDFDCSGDVVRGREALAVLMASA